MALQKISKEKFQELMNQNQLPVLVEFMAPWCGFCRRIAAAMEKIEQQYAGKLIVAQVDIDSEPELEQQEQIEVVPTLLVYKNGKAVASAVAPESKAAIERLIAQGLEAE